MHTKLWVTLGSLGLCLNLACAGKSPAPEAQPDQSGAFSVTAAPAPENPQPKVLPAPGTAHPPLPAEADARVVIDKSTIGFDDGDSFSIGDEQIRVLGIDTPEIKHPEHGIAMDQPYGREAAEFTENLLRNAEVVEYMPVDKDPYGRSLSHIFVDGELLSVHVLWAGLAVENVSRYGDNGTPEIAAYILEASKNLPKPPFQDPHYWRRANQVR